MSKYKLVDDLAEIDLSIERGFFKVVKDDYTAYDTRVCIGMDIIYVSSDDECQYWKGNGGNDKITKEEFKQEYKIRTSDLYRAVHNTEK